MYIFTPAQEKAIAKAKSNNKEFLYIGHYITATGEYILKVGTTNDLSRRQGEHTRNYRKTPHYPLVAGSQFEYDGFIPLSKFTTLRVEENTKKDWISRQFGQYLNNDRFVFSEKPTKIEIKVRKIYEIAL